MRGRVLNDIYEKLGVKAPKETALESEGAEMTATEL